MFEGKYNEQGFPIFTKADTVEVTNSENYKTEVTNVADTSNKTRTKNKNQER